MAANFFSFPHTAPPLISFHSPAFGFASFRCSFHFIHHLRFLRPLHSLQLSCYTKQKNVLADLICQPQNKYSRRGMVTALFSDRLYPHPWLGFTCLLPLSVNFCQYAKRGKKSSAAVLITHQPFFHTLTVNLFYKLLANSAT